MFKEWSESDGMEGLGSSSTTASSNSFSFFSPSHRGLFAIVYNQPLIAAFLSFAIAQALKVVTTWYKEKRWDFKRILQSGGMPSSHSATVMGLAATVGFREGPASHLFAACLVLASVVMYDASGVRLQAGRQAEVLNQIVYELPPEHPLADSRPLREPLGHTPPQVAAGAILGCVMAYVLFLVSPSGVLPAKP